MVPLKEENLRPYEKFTARGAVLRSKADNLGPYEKFATQLQLIPRRPLDF